MKHLIVVGVLLVGLSNEALAQGVDVHTRWGPSGSHVPLPEGMPLFAYEATIAGAATPYEVKLEVFHNGILSFVDSKVVPIPGQPYDYSVPVHMGGWGLRSGDTVTFVLKVIDTASGATLATHYLHGDVAGS